MYVYGQVVSDVFKASRWFITCYILQCVCLYGLATNRFCSVMLRLVQMSVPPAGRSSLSLAASRLLPLALP